MAEVDIAKAGLAWATKRFPEEASVLQWLTRTDMEFRELCEEYGLAHQSLAGFEARPDAAERPEVEEYRAVIAELEGEIDRFLRKAKRRD